MPSIVCRKPRSSRGSGKGHLLPSVRQVAKLLSDDPTERAELIQEAMVALWQEDPTRFNFRNGADVSQIKKILRDRMVAFHWARTEVADDTEFTASVVHHWGLA